MTKNDFFKQYGSQLIAVFHDDVETGDLMLYADQEENLAVKYQESGYKICTAYNDNGNEWVDLSFDKSNNDNKIGYYIMQEIV